MKYLITGGSGFIGAHLTESLLKDGHKVVVLDDFSTGPRSNLAAVADNPNLEIIEADLLNFSGLEYVASKCDTIFHLAAAVGVELVVHDPVRTIVTNVHGTERILKAAASTGKRILITSTSEVYGKSQEPRFSETDDLLIGPPANSRWSYACSKLLDEFFAMAYYRAGRLPVMLVRLFNTVGPRQTGRYGMVLPRFVSRALAGESLLVYGDGAQTRCFCHVFDTIRALRGLSENNQAIGQVLNIGSDRQISILELAELVIERLGSSSGIEFVPYDQAYESGFEDMRHRRPDTSAVNSMIGWKAEIDLERIIDDVAEHQRSRG